MFVVISLRFIARDFRVDFLKLTPLRDFESSSREGQKSIGSHLKLLVVSWLSKHQHTSIYANKKKTDLPTYSTNST